MNELEKKNQRIKVSKAKQSYENYINSAEETNDYKEQKIGIWLLSHSNMLLKEKHIGVGKYISCSEGTLVYCDFGINPGAEISGWHFAVTLNKDDNSFNPILTVVPLTSKNKIYYLDLSTEVYDRTIYAITEKMKKFNTETEKLRSCMSLVEKYREVDCDPNSKEEVKSAFFLQTFKFVLHLCEIDFEDVKDNENLGNIMDASLIKFTDMIQNFVESLRELIVIKTKYEKYKNNTYAAIPQITTISKLRLSVRMNKFDPIATVQVSDIVLSKLKTECIKWIG